MLNLSELTFKVNTDALVQAAEKIAALGKSVEGLQGSFSKLEKGAAASEKALAEANRKNAQAAKANAEAALLQAKALTEVERAENLKVKTIQASTKATEESTRSVSSNVSMLQRQQDIYGFMIEGFSRGQSSILATAKAAGILADEMKTLKTVLQDQRALLSDPFDKSLSGLLSLKNELAVATRVQSMYTAELGLTKKQMRELAVDEMRLTTMLKEQGKSTQEIDAALKKLNQEYIKTAGNVNQVLTAEQALERQRKETADANNAIEREMQRVNYALQTQNNELNKGTANALFRFEQNLKRSGLTLAEQKKKLEEYRTSLLALEKAKGSTQTDYISRALGPQITDIFVGLATGQNPLTVMLQQGGQLRDQLAQAGVAAEDMGNTMRTAARSMVTSVAAVAGAFKDLLVGAFLDTGAALTNIVVQGSGFNIVLDKAKAKIAAGGEQNFKYIGTLTRLGEVFKVAVAASIAASTVALLAFGVAMVQVMKAQDAMTIALVSSGASLGITTNQATEMAKAVDRTGASFSGVLDIFAMIAEKGNISAESMQKITEAALKLEAVGGASVEKTVEQFSKLADDPVKALSEYTQATGLLTQAEIARIEKLVELGQETTAVKEATEMLSAAKQKEAALIYAGLSPLSRVWLDIKNGIKEAWGAFQEFTGSSALVTVLKNALQVVAVIATEVWFAVKGIGQSLGGLGAVAAAVMTDIKNLDTNFTSSKNVLGLIKETDEARKVAYKDAIDRIMQQGAYERSELEKTAQAQAQVNKENSDAENERLSYQAAMKPWKEAEQKGAKDLLTRQQFINKAIEDTNKGLKEGTSLREKDVELIKKMAGLEWDKANKPKKDPSENYYATLLRDSTNATIRADEATQDLTKSQLKMLEVINDPRFAKLSENRQTEVLRNYAVAASNEKIAEGQELINKLLGKGEGLGKEYYATLAKLESLKGNAGIDQEQLEKALQALRDTTPEAKRVRDEIKAAAEAYNQYSANAIASLESTKIGNQQLDYRLSVLGKSTEEQRKMKIQQDASVKLMQAEVKYAKEVLKIRQDTKLQNDPMLMAKALQDAETAYAEERKLINREVAVEAAEDFQKEFDRISNGVTDSIVTALFEGGKSGSKKLRDLVVAELKKPVTMVVSAVVNTVLGNVIGSLLGGAAAGAAGGAAGGIASGIGSSIAGSAILSGIGMMGTEGLANIVGFLGGDALGVLGAGATGGFSSAIAAAIGQIPVWGWIAGGLLAIASSLDDSGTYHTGGAARYSQSRGLSAGQSGEDFDIGFGRVERGDQTVSAMGQLSKALVDIFDGIAKTFGKTAGYEVATAFADDTSEDGAWGAFAVRLQGVEILNWDDFRQSKWAPKEFGDGEEGYKQYLAALAKDTRKILTDMDIPGWAKTILNDIGENPSMEALSSAIQLLAQVEATFKSFGQYMPQFANLADSAKEALIKASGGVGALTSNMSTFVNAFYTDAEKLAISSNNLSEELSKLGFEMPKTREEFKALVQSQIELGDSGAVSVAALLSLSGAMDAVLPAFNAVEDAVNSLSEVADAFWSSFTKSASSMKDLESQIASAEAKRQRQSAIKSLELQRDALKQQLQNAEALVDASKSLRDYVRDLRVGELSSLTESQKLSQYSQQYSTQMSLARGGDVKAFSNLQGLSTDYLGLIKSNSSSSFDYSKQFMLMTNELDSLAAVTEDANRSLAEDTKKKLESIDSQLALLNDTGLDQLSVLRDQLNQEKQQFIQDINNTTKQVIALDSIKSALDALPADMASLLSSSIATAISPMISSIMSAVSGLSRPTSSVDQIVSNIASGKTTIASALYDAVAPAIVEVSTRTVEAKIDTYAALRNAGMTDTQLRAITEQSVGVQTETDWNYIKSMAGFASGGFTGFGSVNEPAGIVHKGEVVFNQSDVRRFGGPVALDSLRQNGFTSSDSSSDSAATEVRALREENKAQALAMVQLQAKLTKIIERWDGQGMPEVRAV